MPKLFLILFFAVLSVTGKAQKVFFVYIQAETEQPFFIKMNDNVYSSSASGYLILPKLSNESYQLTVGFPMNKWPDQSFNISINNRDHGYLLKNFSEKGWGLFDLQTLSVQMSGSKADGKVGVISQPNQHVSEFTEILARAADDPSLREKPVRVKEEPKTVVVTEVKNEKPAVISSDTPQENTVAVKNEEVAPTNKVVKQTENAVEKKEETGKVQDPVVNKEDKRTVPDEKRNTTITPLPETKKDAEKQPDIVTTDNAVIVKKEPVTEVSTEESKKILERTDEEFRRSAVTKKTESSTSEGLGITFIDIQTNGEKDTIQLVIPNPKPVVPLVKKEPEAEKKFLDISTDRVEEKETPPVVTTIVPSNSCNGIASESDFLKLRKRLATANGDQDMLNEAAKYFKTKCFTTAQVKNLGSMFLNDGAKYKFYDAAYTAVTDLAKFSSLETELTDPYYINRFKAILK